MVTVSCAGCGVLYDASKLRFKQTTPSGRSTTECRVCGATLYECVDETMLVEIDDLPD